MTVRVAKFADILGIVSVMKDAHARSIYAETGTFDEPAAKHMLARSIQRHGHHNLGGTFVLVSEAPTDSGLAVEGFIIGYLDTVNPCLKELMVTDILFIMTERADVRDALKMIKRVLEWGEDNPKVIEANFGITSDLGDWERKKVLYERLGLSQTGGMMSRGFSR